MLKSRTIRIPRVSAPLRDKKIYPLYTIKHNDTEITMIQIKHY